ncbi:MAG TPA: class I SAM-dependent methyltransferase [Bacteroidia bacterium]|nr:class I SAM-dependent methyltransferase [Bacteroidia bacterium]
MSLAGECDHWFEDWFDSPFYPMLYAHRSEQEADELVDNLVKVLALPPASRILDLGCGRGRHSTGLARHGYDVTGVDLSAASISDAKKQEHENLHFWIHDMRRPVAVNYFDATVNLFTSFGYFTSPLDNVRTIDAVHTELKPNGVFLIDYFNSTKVRRLVGDCHTGEKTVGDVHFSWVKTIENNAVRKKITVKESGMEHLFCEHVQLFSLDEFKKMLEPKFNLLHVFGDYALSAFDEVNSDRLILLCRKK